MRNCIIIFSFILAFTHDFANYLPPARAQETSPISTSSTLSISTIIESEDENPATTIVTNSLSVNLDETATTIINNEDSTSYMTDERSSSTPVNAEAEEASGIEAKSISSASENSLIGESDEPNAKSIDSSEANDDSTTSRQPPDGGTMHGPAVKHTTRSRQPFNMSQVDEVYMYSHKDEHETVESWHRMGRKLKKGVGNIIGSIVPFALNMSQEAKISSNCSGAILKWVLSMNHLKSWALRMLDASGKPIAGLLEGSLTMFGNYRQCIKIRAPDDDEIEFAGEFREYFRGKYCIVQAKPWLPEKSRFYNLNAKFKALIENEEENQWYDRTIFDELSEWALAFNFVNIRIDICVPSLCSREDIQKAVSFLLKDIDLKARVLRCEWEPTVGTTYGSASIESGSQEIPETLAASAASSTQSTFDSSFSQLGWIMVPAIAITIVLVATALSVAIGDYQEKLTKFNHTIRSLSLKRSVSSHLNVDYDQLADDKPLALYGIRFILVLWVILVESAVNLKFDYLRELLMLKDLIFWWPMQFLINSTLQFDSIILLTAFTMSYKNCLNDGVNNAKTLTKFVVDKYIRLMPSIMVMVALVILLPLVYRGPVWNDYVAKQSAVCQSTGWLNTIFLQNYLTYKEICLPQTWLMCVEFQLVLLISPIVYYLNKNYISHFEGNNEKNSTDNNNRISIINDRQDFIRGGSKKDRTHDATKLFYWLWTTPGIILVGCIALGMGSSFYNVYSNKFPPSWFYTMADPDSKALYFGGHLMRLWTHLAVFAMGIIAGVECRRAAKNVIRGNMDDNIRLVSPNGHFKGLHNKNSYFSSSSSLPVISGNCDSSMSSSKSVNNDNISINIHTTDNSHGNINGMGYNGNSNDNNKSNNGKGCNIFSVICIDIIGCLLAITTMTTIIFSTHDWALNDLPKPLVAGIFDVGSRFLWSMALIWILYMVSVPGEDKRFSLLARTLGHSGMVCLGKLSFLTYLIHPFVHTTVLAIQEQPIYSSWLMLFHILIGNITITVILASLVSLFVEMPCRNLFRRCGTSLLLTHTIGFATAADSASNASTK